MAIVVTEERENSLPVFIIFLFKPLIAKINTLIMVFNLWYHLLKCDDFFSIFDFKMYKALSYYNLILDY